MGRKYGSAVDVPKVASTPTSPSAGWVSLYAKSDDKVYSLSSGGTETDLTATGGGGGTGTTELLASTGYNPATVTSVTNNTATFTDVDATNLTVTFTVPASGAVIVSLTARVSTASVSNPALWGVGVAGTVVAASTSRVSSATASARVVHRVKITGLTSGASVTYRWMHANQGTSTTTTTTYGGTGVTAEGQALMEVWSA